MLDKTWISPDAERLDTEQKRQQDRNVNIGTFTPGRGAGAFKLLFAQQDASLSGLGHTVGISVPVRYAPRYTKGQLEPVENEQPAKMCSVKMSIGEGKALHTSGDFDITVTNRRIAFVTKRETRKGTRIRKGVVRTILEIAVGWLTGGFVKDQILQFGHLWLCSIRTVEVIETKLIIEASPIAKDADTHYLVLRCGSLREANELMHTLSNLVFDELENVSGLTLKRPTPVNRIHFPERPRVGYTSLAEFWAVCAASHQRKEFPWPPKAAPSTAQSFLKNARMCIEKGYDIPHVTFVDPNR
jgi:hypothetical protein